MSDNDRRKLADAFDREIDPLEEYQDTFEDIDVDPFELFIDERVVDRGLADATVGLYDRSFRNWKAFAEEAGRHPACPNKPLMKQFIHHLRDRGTGDDTIKNRINCLNQAYEYWQAAQEFPHPTDYNPIKQAKADIEFESGSVKPPHPLSITDVREKVEEITHIRDRALVLIQLKLGLRATEVCNIKLSEIHIANDDLQAHYDTLGTAADLQGQSNALLIPDDRAGNKSKRPRLLPVDDELRAMLVRYLLIRPDNGEPWLFLSKNRHMQCQQDYINAIWKDTFHPTYEETEQYRSLTSHFGRHFFTTYWRVKQDLNRELIKYMRGDTPGARSLQERGAIDDYIHTYYGDIEEIYREQIYKIGF